MFAALCFGNYGRCVQFADELNHWAAVVRVMCERGLLSSSAAANLSHASYPPAMAMLQYLPERIMRLIDGTRLYSEQYLYVAYQAAAAAVPFFAVSMLPRDEKPGQKIPAALLITVSLFVFAPRLVRFIMIDGYMGLVLALGAIVILESDGSDRSVFAFSSLCFAMTLLKNTGILYAALLCAIALIALRGEKRRLPLWGAVSAAAAFGSWKLLLKLGGATSKFDLNADSFSSGRLGLLPQICRNYFGKFYTGSVVQGDPLLPLPWAFAFLLLLALALLVRRLSQKARRACSVSAALLAVCAGVYIALPVVYAVAFPANEALLLNSHNRYLCLPLSGTFVFLAYALGKYGSGKRMRLFTCALCVMLLPVFPYKEPVRFITRHEAAQSQAFSARFDRTAGLVDEHVPPEDAVEAVVQVLENRNEKVMLIYRLLPRAVSFTYTKEGGYYRAQEGADGSANEADAFRAYLEKNGLRWLLVYTADDRFREQYAPLFESPDAIRDETLYALENGVLKAVG